MTISNQVLKRHHVTGPYYLLEGGGLIFDRQPTEAEAEDMLDFLVGYQESLLWMWAYFLASLPREYGKTFHRAAQVFPEGKRSQSWMDDMRMLGKRCPPEQVRSQFSVSHHMTLFVYYDLTPEERDAYFDLLEQYANSPGSNGHTLSVDDLRNRIRADRNMLPLPDRADSRWDREIAIHRLENDLFEERGKISVVQDVLERDILPILNELSQAGTTLPPALTDSLNKIQDYITSPTPTAQEARWFVFDNSEGGIEVAYRVSKPGDVEVYRYIYETLPDEAKDELVKRLNAQRR